MIWISNFGNEINQYSQACQSSPIQSESTKILNPVEELKNSEKLLYRRKIGWFPIKNLAVGGIPPRCPFSEKVSSYAQSGGTLMLAFMPLRTYSFSMKLPKKSDSNTWETQFFDVRYLEIFENPHSAHRDHEGNQQAGPDAWPFRQ